MAMPKRKVKHGKEDEAVRGSGCRKKTVLSKWASLKLSGIAMSPEEVWRSIHRRKDPSESEEPQEGSCD